MKIRKTKSLVRIALLMAITILLAATPLGYIYIPIVGVSLTIMALPVILGGALLGMPAGIVLGLTFGITSLIKAPTEALGQLLLGLSPFMTIIICIVPRVLIGVVAGLFYKLAQKKPTALLYGIAGGVCSLINTLLFVGLIFVYCHSLVENAFGATVWTVTLLGGLGECVLSAFLCVLIAKPLSRLLNNK